MVSIEVEAVEGYSLDLEVLREERKEGGFS